LLVLGEENSNVSDIIAIDSCGKEKQDDFHALSSHDWPLSIHNLRPQLHYVAGHETFPGKTNRAFPSRRKATVSWNTWVPFISLATQINVIVNDSMGSLTAGFDPARFNQGHYLCTNRHVSHSLEDHVTLRPLRSKKLLV